MQSPISDRRGALARGVCVLGTLFLAACGNLTGLDGSSKFSCKAPEGVHCSSVTANYYNRSGAGDSGAGRQIAPPAAPAVPTRQVTPLAGLDPVALHSPARRLRLWIKAWEDSDRDLADQSYVYVRIDDGHWQVAHVQRAERDLYAPLRPPASPPASQGNALPGAALGKDGIGRINGVVNPPPAGELQRP